MRITQYSNQGVAKPPLIQEPIKLREQQAGLESHACVHKGRFLKIRTVPLVQSEKERYSSNLLMAKALLNYKWRVSEVEFNLILGK